MAQPMSWFEVSFTSIDGDTMSQRMRAVSPAAAIFSMATRFGGWKATSSGYSVRSVRSAWSAE